MEQNNTIAHNIDKLITDRKSIRAFIERAIEPALIAELFEAARWSFSSSNEQPWRYVYATAAQVEWYQTLLNCLMDMNKDWVQKAPLLIACIAKKTMAKDGNLNPKALHDLGAANMLLALQATSLGMQAHPMGGYHNDKAREALQLPEDCEVVAFMAVGYPGNDDHLKDYQKEQEHTRSKRMDQTEFVFNKPFGS
ncbi:MAG: nitroreductase family protein [Bacteroidia bacterium]|nr:nitroreductase family protein [Bacteroidia bacterium]